MVEIEIVALGESNHYSVGVVTVTKDGDVNFVPKINGVQCHFSRLHNGQRHMKIFDGEGKMMETYELGKGLHIKDFRGIESLPAQSFALNTLKPKPRKKGVQKRADGCFMIEMRDYKSSTFNLHTFIFTKDSKEKMEELVKKHRKIASYLFVNCHPMIAMVALNSDSQGK